MRPAFDLSAMLAQLSAFEGDSADSFRDVSTMFARLAPGAVQAYVLMQPSPRLAALRAADGRILRELDDPLDQSGTLPRLDDVLAQHLLSECGPAWITPSRLERGTELYDWLGQPARILRLPVYRAGTALHVALFAFSEAAVDDAATAALDPAQLLLLVNAAIALVSARIRVAALERRGASVLAEVRDLIDVQRALLPDAPQLRGLRYAVHYQPSAMAGGDYYDLMALGEVQLAGAEASLDRTGCLIADVSGHGAGAAMEAVQFDAILRTYQGDDASGPAGALTYANRYFFSRRPRGHFITALAVLLDPQSGLVRFCSAGHLPFLRWRAGVISEHGREGDPPLGILREHVFNEQQLALEHGDLFVLLTDGIPEARNAATQEFGHSRVRQLLQEHAEQGPQAVCAAIIAAVQEHQGNSTGRDDQTLIVLQACWS